MRTWRHIAELIILAYYSGDMSSPNQDFTEEEAIELAVAARDDLLRQEYSPSNGLRHNMPTELFTRRELAVTGDEENGFSATLPNGRADLGLTPDREDIGVYVEPLKGLQNKFRRIPYAFRYSGGYTNLEGNIAWWVTPSGTLGFMKDPGATVAVNVVEPASASDPDDTAKVPDSMVNKIVQYALTMRQRGPLYRKNNRNEAPAS